MLEMWTDGSCIPNPGPGGWGWVLVDGDQEIRNDSGHHPETTNNRMELQAFRQALQWLDLNRQPVAFYLDSEYVRKGITQWVSSWKRRGWRKSDGKPVLNQDLWMQVDELYDRLKPFIEMHWVKGHAGHKWNERADQLAGAWNV